MNTFNATFINKQGLPKMFQMQLKFVENSNSEGSLIIKINTSKVDKLVAHILVNPSSGRIILNCSKVIPVFGIDTYKLGELNIYSIKTLFESF